MRAPVYQYIVAQDFRCFVLVKSECSAIYRACKFTTLRAAINPVWRSLTLSETMYEFRPNRYFITHVSVNACRCEWCGADVGKPCKHKSGRPTKQVHYTRKGLFRATLRETN